MPTSPAGKGIHGSLQAFKCLTTSCQCEAAKAFADYPWEMYCSDCFDGIKTHRFGSVIPV